MMLYDAFTVSLLGPCAYTYTVLPTMSGNGTSIDDQMDSMFATIWYYMTEIQILRRREVEALKGPNHRVELVELMTERFVAIQKTLRGHRKKGELLPEFIERNGKALNVANQRADRCGLAEAEAKHFMDKYDEMVELHEKQRTELRDASNENQKLRDENASLRAEVEDLRNSLRDPGDSTLRAPANLPSVASPEQPAERKVTSEGDDEFQKSAVLLLLFLASNSDSAPEVDIDDVVRRMEARYNEGSPEKRSWSDPLIALAHRVLVDPSRFRGSLSDATEVLGIASDGEGYNHEEKLYELAATVLSNTNPQETDIKAQQQMLQGFMREERFDQVYIWLNSAFSVLIQSLGNEQVKVRNDVVGGFNAELTRQTEGLRIAMQREQGTMVNLMIGVIRDYQANKTVRGPSWQTLYDGVPQVAAALEQALQTGAPTLPDSRMPVVSGRGRGAEETVRVAKEKLSENKKLKKENEKLQKENEKLKEADNEKRGMLMATKTARIQQLEGERSSLRNETKQLRKQLAESEDLPFYKGVVTQLLVTAKQKAWVRDKSNEIAGYARYLTATANLMGSALYSSDWKDARNTPVNYEHLYRRLQEEKGNLQVVFKQGGVDLATLQTRYNSAVQKLQQCEANKKLLKAELAAAQKAPKTRQVSGDEDKECYVGILKILYPGRTGSFPPCADVQARIGAMQSAHDTIGKKVHGVDTWRQLRTQHEAYQTIVDDFMRLYPPPSRSDKKRQRNRSQGGGDANESDPDAAGIALKAAARRDGKRSRKGKSSSTPRRGESSGGWFSRLFSS